MGWGWKPPKILTNPAAELNRIKDAERKRLEDIKNREVARAKAEKDRQIAVANKQKDQVLSGDVAGAASTGHIGMVDTNKAVVQAMEDTKNDMRGIATTYDPIANELFGDDSGSGLHQPADDAIDANTPPTSPDAGETDPLSEKSAAAKFAFQRRLRLKALRDLKNRQEKDNQASAEVGLTTGKKVRA